MKIKTSLIVAMAQNNCIGKDNQMPWHISDDLKRFKTLTTGHPVIMGRKTYESILRYLNKPLPNRTNIVVSRAGFENTHDVPIFSELEQAINHAKSIAEKDGKNEIFIIGGAQIYNQSTQYAECLHLTKIHKNVQGDAFFPEFNKQDWHESERIDNMSHEPPYSFITLARQ